MQSEVLKQLDEVFCQESSCKGFKSVKVLRQNQTHPSGCLKYYWMALLDYSRTNIKLKQCVYLSKLILNTERNRASIIPLGSLFYCLTTIIVKKFFLMSSLNLLWGSSEPLPHPATRYMEEKSTSSPGWLDHASISFMLSIYAWIVFISFLFIHSGLVPLSLDFLHVRKNHS